MVRLLYILILSGFLTSCQTQQPKDKKRADLFLKLGTAHLTKGNYPSALKELLKAERIDKTNPIIYNNLGLAYLVRGRYVEAESNLRKAISINSGYTEARNNLGRVLIHQGKYKEAEYELTKAVDDLTFPAPEKSHSNLGIAYFKQKKYNLAENHLKKSLLLRRKHCVTQSFYGRTLYEKKLFKKALNALDGAIASCDKSRYYEPRYYGALSAYKMGHREQAIAKFEEVIYLGGEGKIVTQSKDMLALLKSGAR